MVTLFHDMMHQKIGVYIDDIHEERERSHASLEKVI
jgi:hypothetical protein